tara:strand:- start:1 stop:126 length:126 start_codon:yes stop_codon:yes gene_type:complete
MVEKRRKRKKSKNNKKNLNKKGGNIAYLRKNMGATINYIRL